MADARELAELESGFWDASSRADGDHYRQRCTQDVLFVFHFGSMDREACAQVIDQNDTPWVSYRFDEVRCIGLGEKTALLSYRATARHEGSAEDMSMFVSSVYVQEGEDWLLALHQQTPRQQT